MQSKVCTNTILLIRADATPQIGTGHVMRCLALAQAWQDAGGQATFVMSSGAPALDERLKLEGMQVVHQPASPGNIDDAAHTVRQAREIAASWVVVDGYHFGSAYQRQLKGAGLSVLFIDDNGHAEHYSADIVLNQNIYANESLYPHRELETKLLLGLPYALLRREFQIWRGWQREIAVQARKVLVTLGGADPDNFTLRVMRALEHLTIDGLEAIVIVGGSNPYYAELQQAAQEISFPIHLQRSVQNVPELMAWADVAISAAGSTCWELAFMGLPSLVIAIADNQRPIASELGKKEAAINLGWHETASSTEITKSLNRLLSDSNKRTDMSRIGQRLVDGNGAERVCKELHSETITLRRACENDCRLLWEWANDAEVRMSAFTSQPIPWERHRQWFVQKLEDENCFIFIAMDQQSRPMGQIRFDVLGDEVEVDVSIARSRRGSGYSSRLIREGVKRLFAITPIECVNAFIKSVNVASIKAFERAGFYRVEETVIKDHAVVHYIYHNRNEG